MKIRKELSTDDKAKWLNHLRAKYYSGVLVIESPISSWASCYSNQKDLQWLVEMVIWDAYGIYHREYLDWIPGIGQIINPMNFEAAVDRNIAFLQKTWQDSPLNKLKRQEV